MMPKVYFIQDEAERVKIGYSGDPLARLMSLQTANGGRLCMLRLIDGGEPTERWLHARFDEMRIQGEWFAFHPAMMTVVPPDELPQRQIVKPRLRMTLRETLREAEALFGDDHPRLMALMLLESMWEDDLSDFIAWVRSRCA
ncbi:GIY-YIG nuclease family protein [Mesorhizobium sp. M0130]|uniref:GIY-YIG nuclease family protein n=1 Tax=Mesorhizobium sp. M0130 TaxID=2956887 RepID=UPI00333C8BDD